MRSVPLKRRAVIANPRNADHYLDCLRLKSKAGDVEHTTVAVTCVARRGRVHQLSQHLWTFAVAIRRDITCPLCAGLSPEADLGIRRSEFDGARLAGLLPTAVPIRFTHLQRS